MLTRYFFQWLILTNSDLRFKIKTLFYNTFIFLHGQLQQLLLSLKTIIFFFSVGSELQIYINNLNKV